MALLNAVARGANRDHWLILREHGGKQNQREGGVPVHQAQAGVLPPVILSILEQSMSPWSVGLAAHHGSNGRSEIESISALAVVKTYTLTYAPTDPSSSAADMAWAWRETLEVSAQPPTAIIKALPRVVAIWALDRPLLVKKEADEAAALRALRGLATRVGADAPPKRIGDMRVPLAGTAPRNLVPAVADVYALSADRRYSIDEIVAANPAAKEWK